MVWNRFDSRELRIAENVRLRSGSEALSIEIDCLPASSAYRSIVQTDRKGEGHKSLGRVRLARLFNPSCHKWLERSTRQISSGYAARSIEIIQRLTARNHRLSVPTTLSEKSWNRAVEDSDYVFWPDRLICSAFCRLVYGRINLLIPEFPLGQRTKAKGKTLRGVEGNFLLFYFYNRSDAPS